VRDATAADLHTVATTLTRAFDDDPVFQVLFGTPMPSARVEQFFAIAAGIAQRRREGLVQVTAGGEGATVWAPPGQWKMPASDIVRHAPGMVRSFRGRMFANLKVLNVLEAHHPEEPHWYLEFIGTDPAHQGKGIGSALLQPMVDRCDEEGIGAYLESSKEANIPFYARFGFEVTERITLPGDVDEWLMWRSPR